MDFAWVAFKDRRSFCVLRGVGVGCFVFPGCVALFVTLDVLFEFYGWGYLVWILFVGPAFIAFCCLFRLCCVHAVSLLLVSLVAMIAYNV